MKEEIDLAINKVITSNSFGNSLADLLVRCSHPQGGTLYVSSIVTSIMKYPLATSSFSSHLFIQQSSSLCIKLARNIFHLFPCNFTGICFGFFKKTLWFFTMIFDRNPTHFLPEIYFSKPLLIRFS